MYSPLVPITIKSRYFQKSISVKRNIVRCTICILMSWQMASGQVNSTPVLTPSPPYARFNEMPVTMVSPLSWLKSYLLAQKDGLTGNIQAAGFPYNSMGWKGIVQLPPGYEEFKLWWPYEQTAYWIDGALRCGYLLKDQALIDSAKSYLDWMLDHRQPNGLLGPAHLGIYRWPHAVLNRAMMAAWYATGNRRIVDALTEHFMASSGDYIKERNIVNIETMCWLYGISGNKDMLQLAVRSYDAYNANTVSDETITGLLSDKVPTDHGVTFLELVKVPAILYMYTGVQKYLLAAEHGFEKLEKHHMLIDGVPSSSEHLNGRESDNVHETCDIADYIWSAGYMLMATGNPKWGDRMERACFNAGIGCVGKDFKTHQYYSSPNQVIADQNSSKWHCIDGWYEQSRPRMAYQPWHDTECCSGNVNRIMPCYMSRMWLKTDSGGIVAALFGPSRIDLPAVKMEPGITIVQQTDYPFNGAVKFQFQCKAGQRISRPFSIRIPAWADSTTILVDGVPVKEKIYNGQFFRISSQLKNGSSIEVHFSMAPRLQIWPGDGVAITSGPLVFAYNIPSERSISKDKPSFLPGFDALSYRPAGEWNYALDIKDAAQASVSRSAALPQNPWLADSVPVHITLPAWKITNWKLLNGYTPGLPSDYELLQKDSITLIPLGATTLRISIFPDVRKRFTISRLDKIPEL